MGYLIELIYSGRLIRPLFVAGAIVLAVMATLLIVSLITTARAWGELDVGLVPRLMRQPLAVPVALLNLGFGVGRTIAVTAAMLVTTLLAMFLIAARARDIGIGGWGVASFVLVIFMLGVGRDPWILGFGYLMVIFLCLAPSNLVR